jgi:hypothetical protein
MKQGIVLLLLVSLGVPGRLGASEAPWTFPQHDDDTTANSFEDLSLAVGSQVRVVRADGSRLDGEFRTAAGGVLTLLADEETLQLPEDGVYRIYLVKGRRGKGALKGLLVGLGITAALGLATMTQATESGEGGLGFGVGLLFAVPISVGVGIIASPDRRELIYENPGFVPPQERSGPATEPARPEVPQMAQPQPPIVAERPVAPQLSPVIPKSFYLRVSGGKSYLGGEPFPGAATEQPSPSTTFTVQGIYRASEHWGFGGEVLFTDAGTWTWTADDRDSIWWRMGGTESRKIVAPGFKVYYFPVVGKNELVINGGVSAFKQKSTLAVQGSQTLSSTKLNPFFNVGLSYHRYVHPKFGIGAEVQYYDAGEQLPSPLVLFSVSLSFRATPPNAR